jgi:hypothetical protein
VLTLEAGPPELRFLVSATLASEEVVFVLYLMWLALAATGKLCLALEPGLGVAILN